jgi:hypothetical protein
MGIWRNIGKIVILVFQITHEQVKWYIHSWTRDTTKKSNTNPLDEISKLKKDEIVKRYNKEQESRERSRVMVEQFKERNGYGEQVEWSENPHTK